MQDVVINQFMSIVKESDTVESLQMLSKLLRQHQATMGAKISLQENSKFSSIANEEPATKRQKFEPQRKFVSTKKSRKSQSSSIVAPTTEEKDNIAVKLLLCNNTPDVISELNE